MVANLFDFHYINYRFRSTEDLNCTKIRRKYVVIKTKLRTFAIVHRLKNS